MFVRVLRLVVEETLVRFKSENKPSEGLLIAVTKAWLMAPVACPASTVSALVCASLHPLQEIYDHTNIYHRS